MWPEWGVKPHLRSTSSKEVSTFLFIFLILFFSISGGAYSTHRVQHNLRPGGSHIGPVLTQVTSFARKCVASIDTAEWPDHVGNPKPVPNIRDFAHYCACFSGCYLDPSENWWQGTAWLHGAITWGPESRDSSMLFSSIQCVCSSHFLLKSLLAV